MISHDELTTIDTLAKRLFEAKVFGSDVPNANVAFAILLAGHELGLEAMASARGITFARGKVSLSADATVAACVRHRDVCLYFRPIASTNTEATYETLRVGMPAPVTLTWTFDQAQKAGLTGNAIWTKHTAAMLRARCSAALARAVYPDFVAGVYDPDEAAEIRGEYDKPRTHDTPAPSLASLDNVSTPRRDHIREATAYVGGDNPTLGEHNTAVAEALAADAAPALPAGLDGFAEHVSAIDIPGEGVEVWRAHRAHIGTLPETTRKVAWLLVCERVERVGKMGEGKGRTWLKRAVADEDKRHAAPAAEAVVEVAS